MTLHTILWSWHIWVLPGGEADVKPLINTYLGKGIMMNRAIGAIGKTAGVNSFGMFYQWGRKDPFTPATTTAGKDTQLYNATGAPVNTKSSGGIGGEWTHSSAKASTITTLTNTPSTYYTGGSSYIPITNTGNLSNDWWNPTAKTLYDPCPSGYRIPPNNTYNGFPMPSWSTNINNGKTWNTSFFSASGYRHSSNGKFINVGSYGSYMMSTSDDTALRHTLNFTSGAVRSSESGYRSVGLSIRCISE